MSNRARQTGLMAASLIAAYLLVLNAVFGGLAMGAHAGAGVALGPAGEVICLNTPAQDGPHDTAGHLPDCCLSGCRTAALTALPPPELAPLPARLALASPVLADPRAGDAPAGIHRLPPNARAPPVA